MAKPIIISPQVKLVDVETGIMSNVWYRAFLALFKIAGTGSGSGNIADVQVGPPVVQVFTQTVMTNTAALAFPATAAQTGSNLTISVPGAVDGDVVTISTPNACALPNSCYNGWVSAPDTVTIRFNNYSTASQTPASGTFRAVVKRF